MMKEKRGKTTRHCVLKKKEGGEKNYGVEGGYGGMKD